MPDAAIEPVIDSTAADAGAEIPTSAESAPAAASPSAPLTDKAQDRIDRITREKYDALRERDYWQQRAERMPEAKPEPVAPVTPPTEEAFGYDKAKYDLAVASYNRQLARNEAQSVLNAERQRYAQEQTMREWQGRETEFSKSKPDYHAKVHDPSLQITNHMADAMRDSKLGPQVAYYLSEHPDTARNIAVLSPIAQGREIGRIEASLETVKAAPPAVSNAPPPPATLETPPESSVEKDPGKMTQAQFVKWRKSFQKK